MRIYKMKGNASRFWFLGRLNLALKLSSNPKITDLFQDKC